MLSMELLGGAVFGSEGLSVAGGKGTVVFCSETQGPSRSTTVILSTNLAVVFWEAKVGVEEVENTS